MRTAFSSTPAVLAACILLAGCDSTTGSAPRPATIAAVSPANLQGVVGTSAGQVVVRVTDEDGDPVRDVPVTWTANGGALASPAARTDRAGQARAAWTLGTTAGVQTVTVRVEGVEPLSFAAIVSPGAAARLEPLRGDGQTGWVHTALDDSLGVRAVDAYGNAVPGATVRWSVVGTADAAGLLSTGETATRADGSTAVRWHLGGTAGEQQARAALAGVTGGELTFRATGRPDPDGPVLRGVSFSPAVVDVGSGPARTHVTVHVTDAGSGTDYIYLDMQNAAGNRFAACAADPVLTSGTRNDGHWTCLVTVPAGVDPGEWRLGMVLMLDRATTETLAFPGASLPTLRVERRDPQTGPRPVLQSLTFSPSTVNVSAGAVTVQVSLHLRAPSGVQLVQMDFESPAWSEPGGATGTVAGCDSQLVLSSGTATDGVWTCSLRFDPGSETGLWRPGMIIVMDNDGAENVYYAPPELPRLLVQG